MTLTLTLLEVSFTIHRMKAEAAIPKAVLGSSFFALTRTEEELSLVLPETIEVESDESEAGWAGFKVEGPLDFGLVGILATLTNTLAEAGIPVFAISTYETDYILVKREQVQEAKEALVSAGYRVRQGSK